MHTIAVKTIVETSRASTGCIPESPRVQPGEESVLPKRGEKKIADLLSDLYSFLSVGSQPHTPNLYESMSPAPANDPVLAQAAPPWDSQQDKRPIIYENCLKCRGELCHPLPQVTPAKMPHNRGINGPQSFPIELHLKKSQDIDNTADEELLQELLRDIDEQCHTKDVHDSTDIGGKRNPWVYCVPLIL